MAVEEDLLYPLIILGLGTLITVILVPKFSAKYQEKQKDLDRNREDRRFELEIKKELLTEIGKVHQTQIVPLWGGKTAVEEMSKIPKAEITAALNEIIKEGLHVERLINLYYGDDKIEEYWHNFMFDLIDSLRELQKEKFDEKIVKAYYANSEIKLTKLVDEIKQTTPSFLK